MSADSSSRVSESVEGIMDGPTPILKHRSENRVTRELKNVALKGCDPQLRALAECSHGRLFSVVWACRSQNRAVNECLTAFSHDEELRNKLRREHAKEFPGSVVGYKGDENSIDA